MKQKPASRHAFTLMELLVVIGIIAVLAALLLPAMKGAKVRGNQTAALGNMRQIGAAFIMYASDNNFELPSASYLSRSNNDKWPKLLAQYLQDTSVYAAPGDPQNFIMRKVEPLDNKTNNTSFIMNGFNDLGTFKSKDMVIRLNQIESSTNTVLLGMPKSGSIHFFMDFLEPPHGNTKDILNLKMYGDGSNYLFLDGSARFIAEKDYKDTIWLADKTFVIPEL